MVKPAVIRRFLLEEIQHYEQLDSSRPIEMYQTVLRFSWGLMEKALRLCPEGVLPERAWINLLRFATVAVVGENLGTTAAVKLTQTLSLERIVWNMLHYFLGKEKDEEAIWCVITSEARSETSCGRGRPCLQLGRSAKGRTRVLGSVYP